LLKGCSCSKDEFNDCTSEAEVDFYDDDIDRRLEGPGTDAYAQAVRNVVEMFGGVDKVPGYVPPVKDVTGL
jgi:hypothetical protein